MKEVKKVYKNFVFDLYGTLADIHTDEGYPKLWQKVVEKYVENGALYSVKEFRKYYFQYLEDEKADILKRHPDFTDLEVQIQKVFRRLFETKGVYPKEDLILEVALLFRRESRDYIKLYDGALELLTELKKRGKVYLLSNAQHYFTWDELDILGIRDIFDGILISSDYECCKPDIHFFQAIIKKYSLDPNETIMVGNDPNSDIKGAIAVGFDTLYIHTNISPPINYNTGCTYFIPDGDTLKYKDYLL